MTLATLRWMRKCARLIAALSPDEQTCRPFRISATEMLEVLDLAIAQSEKP